MMISVDLNITKIINFQGNREVESKCLCFHCAYVRDTESVPVLCACVPVCLCACVLVVHRVAAMFVQLVAQNVGAAAFNASVLDFRKFKHCVFPLLLIVHLDVLQRVWRRRLSVNLNTGLCPISERLCRLFLLALTLAF